MSFLDSLSYLIPQFRYSKFYARAKGAQDARLGLPPIVDLDAEARRLLETAGMLESHPHVGFAAWLLEKLQLPDQGLKAWLMSQQRYFLGYLSELRNLGEEFKESAVDALLRRDGKLKARYSQIKYRYEEAQAESNLFQRLYPDYPKERLLAPWMYWLIMAVVLIIEVPINLVALQLLGEGQALCLLVAIVIGLVIAVTAHWVGCAVNQPVKTPIDWCMLVVSVLVVVSAILGIAVIRHFYLVAQERPTMPWHGLFFVFVQLLTFAGGIHLARESSNTYRDLQDAEAALARKIKLCDDERSKLRSRLTTELEAYHRMIQELAAAYGNENRINKGSITQTVPEIRFGEWTDFADVDRDIPELPQARSRSRAAQSPETKGEVVQ